MTETECKKEKLNELLNECETLADWAEPYVREENPNTGKGLIVANYLDDLGRHYDEALALYQEQTLLCKECITPCEAGFDERIKGIEKRMNELNKKWEAKTNA